MVVEVDAGSRDSKSASARVLFAQGHRGTGDQSKASTTLTPSIRKGTLTSAVTLVRWFSLIDLRF